LAEVTDLYSVFDFTVDWTICTLFVRLSGFIGASYIMVYFELNDLIN